MEAARIQAFSETELAKIESEKLVVNKESEKRLKEI